MQVTSIKVDARLSRAQIAQYILVISEATKEVYNKLWSRLVRKSDATAATSVNSLDAIIVSNSYLTSSITNLLKAITNLSKARVSHNPLKDRIEPLRNDNLNESESKFQSKKEEYNENNDLPKIID